MKPPQDEYDKIPPLPRDGSDFIHIPGVYCQGCGRSFALYSYSAIGPNGIDENGKPFMNVCPFCPKDKP